MLKRILLILIFFVGVPLLWITANKIKGIDGPRSILSSKVSIKQAAELKINIVDIIELTNKERVLAGLPPLSTNNLLSDSADLKVDDMIALQYFEHQSPNGDSVSDLGTKVGYDYVVMGENLALGTFSNSAEIVQAWMDSPGHRANILNKNYQDIGVSVKRALYKGDEVWFAVQHFGTNRSVCPSIDQSLKTDIDVTNNELKGEESTINILKRALEAPGASSSPNYSENIKLFNKNVDDYNSKLQVSKQKINNYNSQVKEFNRCIATFQ
ncbi:MAG: hypothetical protein KBC11_00590 [Candidatus Pacebacteria bacterium]|nr:hypothetical protein [Candidatus Paceibacterota bacterium]